MGAQQFSDIGLPKVVAIVVTYRRPGPLRATLDALASQSVMPEGVVVVDNDGGSASVERAKYPFDIRHLPAQNYGYAAGLATGISIACQAWPHADFFFLSDDDSQSPPNVIHDCLDVASATGAPVGLVVTQCGAERLGGPEWGVQAERGEQVDFGLVDQSILSRQAATTVHFREDLFMMFEDIDLCRRLRQAGFSISYSPASPTRQHLGSTQSGGTWRAYYQTRNELRVALDSRRGRYIFSALVRQVRFFVAHLIASKDDPFKSRNMIVARAKGIRDAVQNRMGRTLEPSF